MSSATDVSTRSRFDDLVRTDINRTADILVGSGEWADSAATGIDVGTLGGRFRITFPHLQESETETESEEGLGLNDPIEFLQRLHEIDLTAQSDPSRQLGRILARALFTTAESFESIPIQAEEVASWLSRLVDAPSHQRNSLRSAVIRFSSPENILAAALQQYDRTGRQQYLEIAISLLEARRSAAWPALLSLAHSDRAECELFVRLIADCVGVSDNERESAFEALALNPHADVRASLFEHLFRLPVAAQRRVLQILSSDGDVSIRDEAEELLGELDS